MKWLVDVLMGFALGYLVAFLQYKKGVMDLIRNREETGCELSELEKRREIRRKARRKP